MKAITVRQPWAWAILHGGKDVENRTRNIAGRYRGPLVIHASKGIDPDDFVDALREFDRLRVPRPAGRIADLGFGVALGVVDLLDVHWCFTACDRVPINFPGIGAGIADVNCSKWGNECSQHLVLADPHPFLEPIPYRGRLGLWEFPDELLPEVAW